MLQVSGLTPRARSRQDAIALATWRAFKSSFAHAHRALHIRPVYETELGHVLIFFLNSLRDGRNRGEPEELYEKRRRSRFRTRQEKRIEGARDTKEGDRFDERVRYYYRYVLSSCSFQRVRARITIKRSLFSFFTSRTSALQCINMTTSCLRQVEDKR